MSGKKGFLSLNKRKRVSLSPIFEVESEGPSLRLINAPPPSLFHGRILLLPFQSLKNERNEEKKEIEREREREKEREKEEEEIFERIVFNNQRNEVREKEKEREKEISNSQSEKLTSSSSSSSFSLSENNLWECPKCTLINDLNNNW